MMSATRERATAFEPNSATYRLTTRRRESAHLISPTIADPAEALPGDATIEDLWNFSRC